MEEKKCLKCGRPCQEDQAFCGECLAEMEKYPVKPGVVVLLPPREPSRPGVRRRYTPPSPEEQVVKLKKWVLGLCIALGLTAAAAGIFGWMTINRISSEESIGPVPGQNYSSDSAVPQETH